MSSAIKNDPSRSHRRIHSDDTVLHSKADINQKNVLPVDQFHCSTHIKPDHIKIAGVFNAHNLIQNALREAIMTSLPLALAFTATITSNTLAAPIDYDWSNTASVSNADNWSEVRALIDAEKFADALPLLAALAEKQPGNADVFNLLGYSKRKLGDLDQSGLDYARALRIDPNHRGALEYQGELFLMLDDVEKAEANLTRLEAICETECEEVEELSEAIATWRKDN